MKLEIGYNHTFEVRRETYLANCQDSFSILYLSDLHFNKYSEDISTRIAAKIDELNPSVVLLGGDYIDSQKGLVYFNKLLRSFSHRKNILAIAGNHDDYFGLEKIRSIMVENNVVWLENKSVILKINNTRLKIDGNFISSERSDADFSILVLHKPMHLNQFKDNCDLAFAGHLHGSQFVFWESDYKLYPGRFFYKWNILKTKQENCQYYISKGLGDTLPIRYNCKRDLLFIQVTGINKENTL